MNSNKFSLVPGHNSVPGNDIYLSCHNVGSILHIRIILWRYCILFWGLQELQRDLFNLSVISGLNNGPKLITAAVLDSSLSSLKVKVKVNSKANNKFKDFSRTSRTQAVILRTLQVLQGLLRTVADEGIAVKGFLAIFKQTHVTVFIWSCVILSNCMHLHITLWCISHWSCSWLPILHFLILLPAIHW